MYLVQTKKLILGLNALINEFDRDGIVDRQLEYKRTMDFVDSRSSFLTDELEKIELEKQEFKQNNELYDIKSDVTINVNQKLLIILKYLNWNLKNKYRNT